MVTKKNWWQKSINLREKNYKEERKWKEGGNEEKRENRDEMKKKRGEAVKEKWVSRKKKWKKD